MQDKEQFVRAHGEPVPSTAPYAHFKVMELARDNVVVTLDGQGADEQLAGYHYFFGFYFKELLRQVRWIRLVRESAGYIRTHRSLYGIKTLGYFMLPGKMKNRARVLEKNYLSGDFVREYAAQNTIASSLYSSYGLSDALFNHFDYKLEHLLKWEDRNSMWFSLESRVPFLDYRLVEKTLALEPGQIINKGQTKFILRQAMKGILPEPVRARTDKIGFLTPEESWFRTPVFEKYVKDLVHSASFRQRGFFDPKKVQSRFSAHLSGRENISKEIWKWINLELWFRKFIDSPVKAAGKHSPAYNAG
jgi:asparagine synthase (glutamine-hydrolysing)